MANLAISDQEKRVVVVKRERLIDTLKENREKHDKEYLKALAGYKQEAEAKIREAHDLAKNSLDKNLERSLSSLADVDPTNPRTSDYLVLVQQVSVDLKVPRSYCKEYDAAIAMAEWDTRDELELSHAEFQCFVRDIWDWTEGFKRLTQSYVR